MAKTEQEFKNELIQMFVEIFDDLSTEDKVRVHNIWCENTNHFDDIVYSNDEDTIDEHFAGESPSEILRKAYYGNYKSSDNYFWYNGYANLESSDFEDDMPMESAKWYADYFIDDPEELNYIAEFDEFCDKVSEGFEEEEDEE